MVETAVEQKRAERPSNLLASSPRERETERTAHLCVAENDKSSQPCPTPTIDRPSKSAAATTRLAPSVGSVAVDLTTTNSQKPTTDELETSRGTRLKYCPQAAIDAALARLANLANAASSGDRKALDLLRETLATSHAWRLIADLQRAIEAEMAEKLAPQDILHRELFFKRSSELRAHLAGDKSSLMVKLAASRVVACWIFAQFLELRLHESGEVLTTANVKLMEQAERRIETAMRTLSHAKKLELQLSSA